MAIKMKGLLKGLRYISTIFDEEEKESEMQIGLPTDVKHVAHIGYDGSAANNPSWIENFKGESGGTTIIGDQQTAADPQSLKEGAPVESPPRRKSDKPKKSSTSAGSRNKTDGGDPTSSKPSTRRKKSKSGSSSGQSSSRPSTRGRRTKGKDTCQGSALKVSSDQEDQKKYLNDIPRGIQAM